MGKLRDETVKKIVLLYAINKANKAVYSNFRLQKLMYYCTKDSELHPFTFKHTDHGQYSYDLAATAAELEEMGFVESSPLESENNGFQWRVRDKEIADNIALLMDEISADLKDCIDQDYDEYLYMKQGELDKKAHSDEVLEKVPLLDTIFKSNIPQYFELDLSDDDIEDLEIALNPKLISTVRELINRVDKGEINLEQWVEL